MPRSKRERFIKIAENRTNIILKFLRLLSNCSNKSAYEYAEEDIKKIFSTIEKELKTAKMRFENKDQNRFRLKD